MEFSVFLKNAFLYAETHYEMDVKYVKLLKAMCENIIEHYEAETCEPEEFVDCMYENLD